MVKVNIIAPNISKWSDKLHEFSKREFKQFWDAFFFSEDSFDMYFQILFLKYEYTLVSRNPAILAAEILLNLIKNAKSVEGITKYSEKIIKAIRKHFQLFSFHMFKIASINYNDGSVKMQGYSLSSCLNYKLKLHLELFLEMLIYDPDLASRVDSYLFQIVFYLTL